MWYVYVLENISNKRLYIGYTNDLKRRFAEHNQGRGGAYTKKMGEFKLIYYETYIEKGDAINLKKPACFKRVLCLAGLGQNVSFLMRMAAVGAHQIFSLCIDPLHLTA